MSELFLTVLNMSISTGWIVLGVVILRTLLKKAPKWITVLLWGIAGLRLVMPFSIESVFSLLPATKTITKLPSSPRPYFESGFDALDSRVNSYWKGHYFEGVTKPAQHFSDVTTVLAIIWAVGVIALLLYTVISYLRLKHEIKTAVLLRDNIYQSDTVSSPFVLGVLRPKIFLPFRLDESDAAHIIAHEEAHIRRRDHWWKPLGFLLLSVHWFNPLIWLGYSLLCRDIELACDQKVIRDLEPERRADYSQTLLSCSVNRRMIAACPLAFGEVGIKSRIKSVLSYQKPAFWLIIVAVSVSILFAVCFLTSPKKNTLKNIEGRNLEGRLKNAVSVVIHDGEAFYPTDEVNAAALKKLGELPISPAPISQNRNDDRAKDHAIVLQNKNDTVPSIYSYVRGTYLCFNGNFTEVWILDSVKPTLSYQVLDPDQAKAIFETLNGQQTEVSDEEMPDDWGITMSVRFQTDTQFEAVFQRSLSLSTLLDWDNLITGNAYEIRAVLDNGETMPFGDYMRNVLNYDYLEKEAIFTTIGYMIKPYQELVVKGDLDHIYGKLPPGNYLLCKKVSLVKAPGDSETRVYTAPFTVE